MQQQGPIICGLMTGGVFVIHLEGMLSTKACYKIPYERAQDMEERWVEAWHDKDEK